MWQLIIIDESFDGSFEHHQIVKALSQDIARNYFLLLGMRNPVKTYEKLWFEPQCGSVLALRRSGNAQLSLQNLTAPLIDEIAFLIEGLSYGELITTKLMAAKFKTLDFLGSPKPRSYIASLKASDFRLETETGALKDGGGTRELDALTRVTALQEEHIEALLALNALAFEHSAPETMLRKRLLGGFGRGFGIFSESGILVASLQTECETEGDANLVGVATHPDYRRQGIASYLTRHVAKLLLAEGKNPHLMFDNRDAGRIYEAIGFKIWDQTVHFSRHRED